MYSTNHRLGGSGLLQSVDRGKWFAVAEELSELPDAHFKKVILAFQLLHRARKEERRLERHLKQAPAKAE